MWENVGMIVLIKLARLKKRGVRASKKVNRVSMI